MSRGDKIFFLKKATSKNRHYFFNEALFPAKAGKKAAAKHLICLAAATVQKTALPVQFFSLSAAFDILPDGGFSFALLHEPGKSVGSKDVVSALKNGDAHIL